ncbi:MAG: type II 3-dehydroquinate dehydratase [Lachnospiraceae bacterium]|nr:type II 3-dehydroquinate dehydratase [Lachnospiraceae bacterium]
MKHILLIGFMGCGKTTVAKRLSYTARSPFLDLDDMIVKKEGMAISEIFEKKGEAYFRRVETECLKELLTSKSSYVISTGGGVVLSETNRKILKKLGICIYLRAGENTLYQRLKNDKSRPLLQTDNPRGRIAQILSERKKLYESCADRIVDVDGLTIAKTTEKVWEAFEAERLQRRENKKDRKRILVMHGPNLNFLGIREPEIYGTQTYDDLVNTITEYAKELSLSVTFYQSNHEGALIDRIQQAYRDNVDGIVINPGALTHYSYALHDALASVAAIPKVEVHLSDITKREGFRAISVTKDACQLQIYGKGFEGYRDALMFFSQKNS